MFKKILIANRGEIAVRVIRACREMKIIPVAVYSEADRKALHVRLAEEAYFIGGAKPSDSYLHIEKIIATAKKCGAEAIHPGYGFLAENPRLGQALRRGGDRVHRPAFRGDGDDGREDLGPEENGGGRRAGHPGNAGPDRRREGAQRKAREIGFPLLLKAVGRRRRQGPRLVAREGTARRLPAGPVRSALELRGPGRLYREIHRGAAPHRDPDPGRQLRATSSTWERGSVRSSGATRKSWRRRPRPSWTRRPGGHGQRGRQGGAPASATGTPGRSSSSSTGTRSFISWKSTPGFRWSIRSPRW